MPTGRTLLNPPADQTPGDADERTAPRMPTKGAAVSGRQILRRCSHNARRNSSQSCFPMDGEGAGNGA